MGNCIQVPVHAAVLTDDSSLKRNTTGHEVDEEDFDSVTSSMSGFAASSSFVYSKNTCALEHYDPVRLLGEGSISTVHLVRRRKQRVTIPYKEQATVMARANKIESPATEGSEQQDVAEDWSRGDLYAVKTIRCSHIRNNKSVQEMKDEIFTTSRLHHPNIVHVVEGFERKRHIYMVMECCRGGDLLQVEGTAEQHAKAIVRHILLAVSYMHNKGVVHRDLKLENVLFATPSHKASEVKVIDYGLATNYLANVDKNMTERVGSIYTMAPEVLRGDYDHKCDLVRILSLNPNSQSYDAISPAMRLTKSISFNIYSGLSGWLLTVCYLVQSLSGVPKFTYPGRKEGTFATDHSVIHNKVGLQLTITRTGFSLLLLQSNHD